MIWWKPLTSLCRWSHALRQASFAANLTGSQPRVVNYLARTSYLPARKWLILSISGGDSDSILPKRLQKCARSGPVKTRRRKLLNVRNEAAFCRLVTSDCILDTLHMSVPTRKGYGNGLSGIWVVGVEGWSCECIADVVLAGFELQHSGQALPFRSPTINIDQQKQGYCCLVSRVFCATLS